MPASPSAPQVRLRHAWEWAIGGTLIGATFLLLIALLLLRRINHDEGQYVAGIALMRTGWPYADFAFLQTPLQPLLLAPLAWLPAGFMLLAGRVANAIFATLSAAILFNVLKRRARLANAAFAVGALACTDAFLFAGSLARNDALPMLLLSAAIAALLAGLEHARPSFWFGMAGLLLGLAASAKISAAIPATGAGLFLVVRHRRFGWRAIAIFLAAVAAGLLPTLALALHAPAQFRFDVFTYSLEAPRQYWSSLGRADMFEADRFPRLLRFAAQGMTLAALLVTLVDRRRRDDLLLLDLMILGGIIAACLPEPPYPQYLVPLLPPLTLRFGLALDALRGSFRKFAMGVTVASCLFGLAHTVRAFARAVTAGSEVLASIRVGRDVARLAHGGAIATLSPEMVAGVDANLDRRFVTGPFLFRTGGALGDQALRLGYSPNWQRLADALDNRPPQVILVGGERRPARPRYPNGLDQPLINWASAHAYQRIDFAGTQLALFVRRAAPHR